MLKSIKMGLLCFCVINLSVACSSEDPSITDETPGQNTGNGGNENEGGEEETPAETRYAFRVLTVQVVILPAEQAEKCIQ